MAQIGVPFVKIKDYLEWAITEGCEVRNAHTVNLEEFILVTAPSGRYLIIYDKDSEFVPPREIARYDRRLGLESPPALMENAQIRPFKPKDSKK